MYALSGVLVTFILTVTKYLRGSGSNLRAKRVILARSLRGYSPPWLDKHGWKKDPLWRECDSCFLHFLHHMETLNLMKTGLGYKLQGLINFIQVGPAS